MLNHQIFAQNLAVVAPLSNDPNLSLLWAWFARIASIPHPSHHEDALAEFIITWAKEYGLDARRDDVGNVIIIKPATQGYENRMSIALQAHLDMVPQANADTPHDFVTTPLTLRLNPNDDNWLMATGTTLGADNGIGMASCLAVLESGTLAHPRIEVLLTMTEETGMTGVKGLKAGTITAPIMINTDTEEIGEIYVGCAGGINAGLHLPLDWQSNGFDGAIIFAIKGLKGGHSGLDIDKNHSNAIKMLANILKSLSLDVGVANFAIADIKGGTLRNAIPREAVATLVFNKSYEQKILTSLTTHFENITKQIHKAEPNVSYIIADIDKPKQCLANSGVVIDFVNALPSGVVRFSDIADVVETSLSFGVLSIKRDELVATLLVRSLLENAKPLVCNQLDSIARLAGAKAVFSGDYVGWNPDEHSAITPIVANLYQKILGKAPDIKVIHAGLECGLIKKSHPNLDMVSIGPTIKNAHSPNEMVNIDSVAVYWRLLTDILVNAPVSECHG